MEETNSAEQDHQKTAWEAKVFGRKPAAMWVITAVLGAIVISIFGVPDVEKPESMLPRLFLPVFIIAVYARFGYKYAQSVPTYPLLRNARIGQLADSIYFLGFLWTLWALIDSFVIHQMSIALAVFRAFGYALVTTAFGMFLRLSLLQFLYSIEDQVYSAERTVEEEIARFSETLGTTTTGIKELEPYLTESTRTLKTAVDQIKSQTNGLKDALAEIHKESAQRAVAAVVAQFMEELKPSLEELTKVSSDFVIQVGVELSETTEGISIGLKSSLETIEASIETFTSSLSEQVSDLETSLETVNKTILSGTKLLDEAIKALSRMARRVHRPWWRFWP